MDNKYTKEKYYEQEFNMLKDAHFQTSQKIISFFQYALLIFSTPIALLTSEQISKTILGVVFIVIGLIELVVIAYLSSLRNETLLYARQINRIRNSIYTDKILGEDIECIHRGKILLSQDKKPDYKDSTQFIYIVLVLGLFSGFYGAFGVYQILLYNSQLTTANVIVISVVGGLLMLLYALLRYKLGSVYHENGTSYFKRSIGIDIDGVLNSHEKTFVEICNKINNTKLEVSDISTLPVHNSGKITRNEERLVFETKDYWENQKIVDNVKDCLIDEIRNKYGFKLYVFTARDWEIKRTCAGEKASLNIKKHTKKWLRNEGIKYKKIKFEKGNIDRPVSYFSAKYNNRFFYAKVYRLQFFVEDNVYNAEKLSHICEYVFLINHKYNINEELPYNVIRVDGWQDILGWIKKLS